MSSDSDGKSEAKLKQWHVFAAIVGVVAVWGGMGFYASTREDPAEFGDMFGAVNALFTGLAFSGVIIAILIQRDELAMQREELRLTRAQLAVATFETTFFNLLRLFRETARAINKTGDISGSASYWVRLAKELDTDVKPRADEEPIDKAIARCHRRLEESEVAKAEYFSTLTQLLTALNHAPDRTALRYSGMVQSQLSLHELVVIYYYAATPLGHKVLRPLIENYQLLRTLIPESTDHGSRLRSYYATTAFGD